MSSRARWGTYQQIADVLRNRWSEAEPGSPVPSESALRAEFGVSRTLVRRALAVLEGDGAVRAVPGRGRVIADGISAPVGVRQSVVAALRAKIDTLGAGARLPSEAELGAELGASRITVRAALAELAAAGLVRSEQGRGWFVQGG